MNTISLVRLLILCFGLMAELCMAQPGSGSGRFGTIGASGGGGGSATNVDNSTYTNLVIKGTSTFSGNITGGNGVTNGQLAGVFQGGIIDTNAAMVLASQQGAIQHAEYLPWRGNTVSSQADATNKILYEQSIALPGFNVIATFGVVYQNTYDVNGLIQFNTNNFSGGPSGFRNYLHSQGQRWMLWFDSGNLPTAGTILTPQQFIANWQNILANWQPDIIWLDAPSYQSAFEYNLLAAMIKTNGYPVQFIFGEQAQNFNAQLTSLGSGYRIHIPDGDIVSWSNFVEVANNIDTNLWRYSGQGQFCYLGPESMGAGSNVWDSGTIIALQAMWGQPFLSAFNTNNPTYATYVTNSHLLSVQGDPADICARLVLVTNNFNIYLKPLGSPTGPNFELMFWNTDTAASHSLTVSFSSLNGVQQSAAWLAASNYTYIPYYDGHNWFPTGDSPQNQQTQISVFNIQSHDMALFRLMPTILTPNSIVGTDAAGRQTTTVNGSALQNLNASQLASGTVPLAALGNAVTAIPSTVASNNIPNTFTGTNTVAGETVNGPLTVNGVTTFNGNVTATNLFTVQNLNGDFTKISTTDTTGTTRPRLSIAIGNSPSDANIVAYFGSQFGKNAGFEVTTSTNYTSSTNNGMVFFVTTGSSGAGQISAYTSDGANGYTMIPIQFFNNQALGGIVSVLMETNNNVDFAGKISVTNSVSVNSTNIVVNASTSGTATFSMPFQGTGYKKVMIYCNAALGTASYTYPAAFSQTPVVLSTSGLATSVVTSISTSACTITGATSTGFLFIEGY